MFCQSQSKLQDSYIDRAVKKNSGWHDQVLSAEYWEVVVVWNGLEQFWVPDSYGRPMTNDGRKCEAPGVILRTNPLRMASHFRRRIAIPGRWAIMNLKTRLQFMMIVDQMKLVIFKFRPWRNTLLSAVAAHLEPRNFPRPRFDLYPKWMNSNFGYISSSSFHPRFYRCNDE